MSDKNISKFIKSAILEVLKEESKKRQLNEFNPDTGRFSDEVFTTHQKKITSEKISKFGNYQSYISNEAKDTDIADDVCNIVESASKYILNETEDWFDAISVKRNLKEIKNLAREFYKTAQERQIYTQRMQSLYEDMGNILNRYFEINGELTNEQE